MAVAGTHDLKQRLIVFAVVMIPLIGIWIFYNFFHVGKQTARQEKIIEAALTRIDELENIKINESVVEIGELSLNETHKWPWGDHHTELLGHLSAAARRFWKLYDPSDISTAHTNKEVSEWLVTERKVSRTMADAMASILRIDGLRTGPREKL